MKNKISFTVIGKPFGQKRPRAVRMGGFVRMYSPQENVTYKENVVKAYLQAIRETGIENRYEHTTYGKTPLKIDILALFKKPKFTKKQEALNLVENRYPIKKPDADNIAKAILDGLNGVAYDDDASVVTLSVDKRYVSDNIEVERVEVVIWEQTD